MADSRQAWLSGRHRVLVQALQRLRAARGLPSPARYGATVGIVLLAFAARLALEGVYSYPFITFFPAILISAFIFGRGPGFVATLAGALLAFWFFVEPRHGGAILLPSRLMALGMFVAIGLLAAAGIETMRAAVEELAEANRRLRASDLQKDVLLADINHRLKNSLHAVAGILSNDGRRSRDPFVSMALEDAAARIRVLARVHERLHLDFGAASASLVSMSEFLTSLSTDLQPTLVALRPVKLHVRVDEIRLGVAEAVSVGLLVNELVTNAMRHAFPDGRAGNIWLRLHRSGGSELRLEIEDDGIGAETHADTGGTGTRLIQALAQQLGGTVERAGRNQGTKVAVRFSPPQRM